jgi:hypothetical protein
MSGAKSAGCGGGVTLLWLSCGCGLEYYVGVLTVSLFDNSIEEVGTCSFKNRTCCISGMTSAMELGRQSEVIMTASILLHASQRSNALYKLQTSLYAAVPSRRMQACLSKVLM